MAKEKLFSCPECGLKYKDKEIAKKCESWCSKYKSCNTQVIKFAVK